MNLFVFIFSENEKINTAAIIQKPKEEMNPKRTETMPDTGTIMFKQ